MSFEPKYVVSAFKGEDTVFSFSGERVGVTVKEIGGIRLISGGIVACDPFVCLEPMPFTRRVPPGTYAVRLAIAELDGDQRIAYAGIFFSELPAETWETALLPGQSVDELEPGYEFVYPVDSGTGCFADTEAMKQINAGLEDGDDYFFKVVKLMDRTYVHTRSWGEITPVPGGGNVFLFSSGYGDGGYPSYFGLDAKETPCCLVTDFYILGDEATEEADPDTPD